MGNAIGSAVPPLWFLLMWKDANATGAVVAAWGGMVLALTTWLIVCQVEFGEITLDNLGTLNPNLAGNIMALGSSTLIHVVFSKVNPQNYDYKSMGDIQMLEQDMSGLDEKDYSNEFLDEALGWIKKWGYGFTILMVLIWPLLSLPAGVFTKDYFSFWVFVSIAWSFVATVVIISLPLYESKDAMIGVVYYMLGKQKPVQTAEAAETAAPATSEEPKQMADEVGEVSC